MALTTTADRAHPHPSARQGYKMKNEDRYGTRVEGGIHTAVEAWCEDQDAAKL